MHSSDRMNNTILAGRSVGRSLAALALVGLAAGSLAHAQVTSVPPVVFSNSAYLSGSNSQGANSTPDYTANIGRIASNQRGDVFAVFANNTSGYDSLVEIPAGTNTQVLLAKHLDPSSNYVPTTAVTVDPHGNLWFLALAPDGYDSGVDVIPFVNGAYASGIDLATTTLPTCPLPAITTKVPCAYPNIVASNFYGYLQLSDLAVDAAGNLFVVDWADSVSGYDGDIQVIEYNAETGADAIVLGNIPPFGSCCNGDTNGRLALDLNDDIFYVDQLHFLYSAAGSGTFTSIPGFSAASGVSSDSGGNIYVTDTGNNRIAVLPNIGGVVSPSDAYTIVSGSILNATPYYSVGVDGYGAITYPSSSNGEVIDRASVGSFNFGSIAVGSTTAANSVSLYFTAAETMGALSVTGPFAVASNSCPANTAYMIGETCAITLTYTASAAGPQDGSVEAYSNAGALLGTARLQGSGIASLINVDPGTVTGIGTTWTAPSAIAVDAAGSTYVADKTTGDIYKNGGTTPIATGFSSPTAIVVDGAGNLYVGDSGNNRIAEVPYTGTGYGTAATVYSGLSGPTGLGIDAAGNLYVADSGNDRVLLLASGGGLPPGSNVSYIGGSVTSSGSLDTGFTKPVAVASDSLGNVYVADSGEIFQVSVTNGVTTPVAQGLGTAAAVAVDPGGNVYYADSQTKTITRLPNVGGSVTGSGSTILSPSVVPVPTGIAFDSSGNLYAVDTTDAVVSELSRNPGSLIFGAVVQNVASSPVTATLFNSGTASTALASPYEVASGGNSADFGLQDTSTCANGNSIATGTFCSVVEVFTPTTTSSESSTLTFTNNAASLLLSGTGVPLVNATITGPASVVYGAAGSFSVSVSPVVASSYPVNFTNAQGVSYPTTVAISSGGTGTLTSPVTLPVGSYTVALVGTVGSTTVTVTQATLVASVDSFTRAYGQPNPVFTCKFTSGIVNGDAISCVGSVASNVTSATSPGTYPISPTALGAAAANYNIAPSPTSTFGTLTITAAAVNVSIKITSATTSIGTTLPGTPVTLSAQVISLVAGGAEPTGTVTFENVTLANAITDIGTAQQLDDTGAASVTTSTLAIGTIYVEAVYSGDANYAPTHSIPTQVTISAPTFTMALNPQILQVKQGQFGTVTLTLTPIGNYTAPISFSCSGLPLESSCAFSSPITTLNNPATQSVTVVISTTAASTAEMRRPVPWGGMGGGVAVALMVGVFAGWRRKRFKSGLITFLLLAVFSLLPITGCGNGLNEPNFVTPLGTYPSVTITGASNSTGVVVPVTLRLSVTAM
jgi:sugar lactone lactonase YvrE